MLGDVLLDRLTVTRGLRVSVEAFEIEEACVSDVFLVDKDGEGVEVVRSISMFLSGDEYV